MTRTELNIWLGMAFDLNESQTSVVLKNKEIESLNFANRDLRLSLKAKEVEVLEEKKKGLNYKADFDSEKKRADNAVKNTERGKVIKWVLASVAIVEGVYITIKSTSK